MRGYRWLTGCRTEQPEPKHLGRMLQLPSRNVAAVWRFKRPMQSRHDVRGRSSHERDSTPSVRRQGEGGRASSFQILHGVRAFVDERSLLERTCSARPRPWLVDRKRGAGDGRHHRARERRPRGFRRSSVALAHRVRRRELTPIVRDGMVPDVQSPRARRSASHRSLTRGPAARRSHASSARFSMRRLRSCS